VNDVVLTKSRERQVADAMSVIEAMTPTQMPLALPIDPLRIAELSKALAAAQQQCRAVAKDSVNSYHRYRYTSAEAIITEAKAALADSGLALLPVEQTINGSDGNGAGRYELVRMFLLLHSSGQCLPLRSAWPVVPEKGRPLDKAAGAAATLSLAYLLRDLLLMPRVNSEDDVPGRRDAGQPAAGAEPAPDRAGVDQLTELRRLKTDLKLTAEQWATALRKRGVASARDLTPDQAQDLIGKLSHRANCAMLAEGLREQAKTETEAAIPADVAGEGGGAKAEPKSAAAD
jgi:hypothetical protein